MAVSHFELLGVPERFDLDAALLEKSYLERSRAVHPDRFAAAPAAERVAALQQSRQLNDAYQTLKKAVPRAEYLLTRRGQRIGDHEKVDVGFLHEVLELREELSEARLAGRLDEVARLEQTMKQRRKALVAKLAPGFENEALDSVKRTLIELRYVDRYLEECAVALDDEDA